MSTNLNLMVVREMFFAVVVLYTATVIVPRSFPAITPDIQIVKFIYLAWRGTALFRFGLMQQAVPKTRLKEFVERYLYSQDGWEQRKALRVLSIVAGDRFGVRLFSSKGRQHAIELWRKWWEEHGRSVNWDSSIKRYVEHQSWSLADLTDGSMH